MDLLFRIAMINTSKTLRLVGIFILGGYALYATALPQAVGTNPQVEKITQIIPYYEKASQQDWPTIQLNKLLKVSQHDSSIPTIRHQLTILGDLQPSAAENTMVYDAALRQGVEHFQWRHGLKVDGVIGPQTVAALNISPTKRLQQLEANLHRWQNFPNLGDNYIWVNVPSYQLEFIQSGKVTLSLRVIVGKPDLPTPELYGHISRIVLNPPWNIPNSIIQKELIPKILENPGYLAANNIRIYSNWEDNAQVISPYRLAWGNLRKSGNFPYKMSQLPGKNNPLGQIKFVFENSEDVYMHDTQAKALFDTPIRAYSHGCIRLENPFKLADSLSQNTGLSEGEIRDYAANGRTRYLPLKSTIPIYIGYITAWVDENNQPHFLEDIYGRDVGKPKTITLDQDDPR